MMLQVVLVAGTLQAATAETFQVRVDTSKGTFTLLVHPDWAPLGAARFRELVEARFFDNSRFFRVRPGVFVQFGIAGDPKVAERWRESRIADDPRGEANRRGRVFYAMTGPGTRTTQVVINLRDNPEFDKEGFVPFGEVVEGMGVVDSLYSGYGESAGGGMRGGKQERIFAEGNRHLDAEFPRLDRLLRAVLVDSR